MKKKKIIKKALTEQFVAKGKRTLLKKPTVKLPSVSARKAIVSDVEKQRLVAPGRTGYFKEELMEEARWLN
jgi:hypothetical protein